MKDAWKLILGFALLLAAAGNLPVPTVDPIPDVPKPPVVISDPAPFKADRLTVLIVEDSGERRNLPASQVGIFTSSKLRKGLVDAGADFRFWSITEDGEHDTAAFREAAKVPRESVPWIVIANGQRGFSGPLPKDAVGVLDLVGKYK